MKRETKLKIADKVFDSVYIFLMMFLCVWCTGVIASLMVARDYREHLGMFIIFWIALICVVLPILLVIQTTALKYIKKYEGK